MELEELKASFTFSPASPPPGGYRQDPDRVCRGNGSNANNGSNAKPMAPASAEAAHPARASPEEFDHQQEFDHEEDVDAAPWGGIASPDPPGTNYLTSGKKIGRDAGFGEDVLGEAGGGGAPPAFAVDGQIDGQMSPRSCLSMPPALSQRQRSSASVTSIEEV